MRGPRVTLARESPRDSPVRKEYLLVPLPAGAFRSPFAPFHNLSLGAPAMGAGFCGGPSLFG
jgi:hypothetical protein